MTKTNNFPISVDRHIYYVNFSAFGEDSPIWFSVVRDPVKKVTSRFYYHRITPKPGRQIPNIRNYTSYENFVDCVYKKGDDCTFVDGKPYDLSIPYFCGHEYECM